MKPTNSQSVQSLAGNLNKIERIDARLDFILTFAYIAASIYAIYEYSSKKMLLLLLLIIVIVSIFIRLIKMLSRVIGNLISDYLLAGAPFNKPLHKYDTMNKWMETSWQFVIHVSMSLFELYVLSSEPWYTTTISCFIPHTDIQEQKFSVSLLYTVQISIWIATAFSHRFIDERRKDYVIMFVHHTVTILLLVCSLSHGYVRIGVLVLIVHDFSDIFVDLLEFSYYLKLQNARGLFLYEILFVTNLLVWMYMRLYILPVKVIFSSMYECHLQLAKAFNGKPWLNPNDPPGYLFANILLVILYTFHIWWFFLFCRIPYKFITKPPEMIYDDYGYSDSDNDVTVE